MKKPSRTKRGTQRRATDAARKAKGREQSVDMERVASNRALAHKYERDRKRIRHNVVSRNIAASRLAASLPLTALATGFESPSRFGIEMIDAQHDFREDVPYGHPRSAGMPGFGKIGSLANAVIEASFRAPQARIKASDESVDTPNASIDRLDRTR